MNTNTKEKVFILIDGSNFYHRLKETSNQEASLLVFDYERFAKWLTGPRSVVKKTYYVGAIRAKPNDAKAQILRKNQQRLFAKLRQFGFDIERGYILSSEEGHHDKGVDVQIAVDLLIGAYENLYDAAILVSSDTDLIPALAKVRSMKKKIEYIGFSHKPSYALITHSDIRRLLIKEEISQFLV